MRVSNLPDSADRLFLYEHFAPYGATLSVALDEAGCSGLVRYAEPSAAARAVQDLHNSTAGNRRLQVTIV